VKIYERTEKIPYTLIDEIKQIYQRFIPNGPVVIFTEVLNLILKFLTDKTMEVEVSVMISTFSRAAAKFNLNTSELFSSFNYVRTEWNKHKDSQTSLSVILLDNMVEFFSNFSYPKEFVAELIELMNAGS
jgi:hypothetical protein